MVSEAVYTCLKYSKGFKPEKSDNPFAYLTQICKNSFKGYLNAQKKYKNIKDECYKKQNLVPNNPYIAIDYKDLKKWDTVTKEDEDK